MSVAVVDIRRGEFARAVVAVAEIHLHTAVLFAANHRRASGFFLDSGAQGLTHQLVRETAFAEGMWYLYDYAESAQPPVPMGLNHWTVSQAISSYIQMLDFAAGTVFDPDECHAIKYCLSVCLRANARFTSRDGWLPFVRSAPS